MRLLRRFTTILRARRLEADLAEELEHHRALRQEAFERSGLAPAEAEAASRRALGNTAIAREDAREIWVGRWLDGLRQDALHALRTVRREPGFVSAVVLVMALGIGATATVFSLIDGLLLKPLPVSEPQRLAYFTRPAFSYPVYAAVRGRLADQFSDLFAWNLESVHVDWTGELEPAEILTAAGSMYETLRVGAAAGRVFTPLDDRIGGGPDGRVAVISHAAWQRRFGANPSVIGRTIRIDHEPFTIIGVAPRTFFGPAPGLAPEIAIPLTTLKTPAALASSSSDWLHLMGRLRDGATLDAADAALQQRWPLVLEETAQPQMPSDRRARYLSRRTSLATGVAGFSRVRNSFAEPLKLLFGLVTLLFAVACASAANLLIARGVARRQELTVRIAIGAGRGRIVRQLLTESIVWTSAGAALGVLFSSWAGNVLVAMLANREEPLVLDLSLNGRLLLFVLSMTVLAAALCAALPAVLATRFAAGTRVQALPASVLPRRPSGTLLVSLQVALTLLLLVGAALFVRSLRQVLSQDAGFDRSRVLVVAVDPEAAGYEGERVARFNTDLVDRLSAIPGVESASLSQMPPLSDEDGTWTQSIAVEGAAPSPETSREVYFNAVSPGYFRTVGIPLLQGRDFARSDTAAAPRVVAINQSLARRFFPGASPIGQRIQMGRNGRERMLEIVAVVGDAKYRRLQDAVPSTAYVAALQQGIDSTLYAEVRPAGSIASIVDAVRREVRAIDGRVPLRLETVTERIRASLVKERVLALLASSLGLVALVLACAAVYGLLAYSVFRQTRAIGLRLALGARRIDVLWLVMRDGLSMTLGGIGAGILASLALGRFARTLLYQVSPADPVSVVGASVVMIAVAVLAALVPSLRASRVDPVAALKIE